MSSSYTTLGRRVLAVYTIKYPGLWQRLRFWHCNPRGGPVVNGDASWRTISGVYLRVGKKIFSFQWRRFMR